MGLQEGPHPCPPPQRELLILLISFALSSRLRPNTVKWANKMLFVDLRHLKSGQEDKKIDFRAERPPHYDLVNIPVDPMTEKKKKVKYIKKEKENQKKVIKRWLNAR